MLIACSSPRSYRGPNFTGARFKRVAVIVEGSPVFRVLFERLVVENLTKEGFSAVQATSALGSTPPDGNKRDPRLAFEAAGADSVLVLGVPSTGQGTWGNPEARLLTLGGETVWVFASTSGGTNSRDLAAYFRAFCDSVTERLAKEQLLLPSTRGS